MKNFIIQIKTGDRVLYITGLVHLILAALLIMLALSDHRIINHENVWMKPFRFAVSIFFFTWTFAWISKFYRHRRLAGLLNYLIAACMFIEIGLIGMQAARGVPSHFNISTTFDATVFSIMGAVIGFNAVLIGIHFVMFTFIERGGELFRAAIIWGMILFLMGNFTGYLMIQNVGAVAGEFNSEAGWFITNWMPSAGDFRIAHFLGMHAIQLLPALAFTLYKVEIDQRWVHAGGLIYFSVLLFLMGYPLAVSG